MNVSKSITLLSIAKNQDGLYACAFDYDMHYLRQYLNSKQIPCMAFSQEMLTTVFDLVDDLLTTDSNVFIFKTDAKCVGLINEIKKEIYKTSASVQLYYISDDVLAGLDSAVQRLPHCESDIYAELAGVADPNAVHDSLDYLPGPLVSAAQALADAESMHWSLNRVTAVGKSLYFTVDRILEEIDGLNRLPKLAKLSLVMPDLFLHPEADRLIKALADKSVKFRYTLNIDFAEISQTQLKSLFALPLASLVCGLPSSCLAKRSTEIKQCIEMAKGIGANLEIYCDVDDFSAKVLQSIKRLIESCQATDRFWFSSASREFHDYVASVNEKDVVPFSASAKREFQTFLNGFIAFTTGNYPPEHSSGYTKHVMIDKGDLEAGQAVALGNFLGINSAVIGYADSAPGAGFALREGTARRRMDYADTSFKLIEDPAASFTHRNLLTRGAGFSSEFRVDDFPFTYPVVSASYGEWVDAGAHEPAFLSVHTPRDFALFSDNIRYFTANGRIKNAYEINGMFQDACRWGGPQNCGLGKLHRFRLGSDNAIRPCGGCSKQVGTLTDSYLGICRSNIALVEREKLKRDCNTCPARDYCSKCTMLPDAIVDTAYCEFRRENIAMAYYFTAIQILRLLKNSSKLVMDTDITTVKISCGTVSHLYKGGLGAANHGIMPYIFLFYLSDQPYLYDMRTSKILKINPVMALVFEGLSIQAQVNEITTSIREKFDMPEDQADYSFKESVKSFQSMSFTRGI